MDVVLLKKLGFILFGITKKGEAVYKKVSSCNGAWNASKGAVNSVSKKLGGVGGKYDIITTDYAIFKEGMEDCRYVRRIVDNMPSGQHSNWLWGDGVSTRLDSKGVNFVDNRRFAWNF